MGMAKKVVSELLAKQYENAWEAKKRGEPVGWSTSIFPQEIPESFGLCICYPENQAAGMGAKKESMANIEVITVFLSLEIDHVIHLSCKALFMYHYKFACH